MMSIFEVRDTIVKYLGDGTNPDEIIDFIKNNYDFIDDEDKQFFIHDVYHQIYCSILTDYLAIRENEGIASKDIDIFVETSINMFSSCESLYKKGKNMMIMFKMLVPEIMMI